MDERDSAVYNAVFVVIILSCQKAERAGNENVKRATNETKTRGKHERYVLLGTIEAIWEWHVINKESGEINRHDDKLAGCDFSMSAGAILEAFAFLYQKTNEPIWLERAALIANYYWDRRDQTTNMIPERPNAGLRHRSPPIEGTGETRLVLVLDPIVDPDNYPEHRILH